MRHLSAYTHSLSRLYRFRDGATETAYLSAITTKDFYLSQSCFVFGVFFFTISSLSYLSGSGLVSDFWIYLAGAGGSLLCLVIGWATPIARRHPVDLHFLFNGFIVAILFSLAFTQPGHWLTSIGGQLVPAGHRLFLESSDGERTDEEPALRAALSAIFGRLEYVVLNNYLFHTGVIFSFHGLRGWTFVWLSISSAIMLYAGCSGTQEVLTILEYCVQQMFSVSWILGLALLLEREQRKKFLAEVLLERQMHASTTADSILNHMLKNTLSDAVAHIELFLAGCAPESALQDGVHCLRRGMRACRERQVYLKLVGGEYIPVQNAVNLREFGEQLVAGRAVSSEFLDAEVLLDGALMGLILDNALSNAFKHGCPDNPEVRFSMEQTALSPAIGMAGIEFVVSNAADPRRRSITPEAFARIIDKTHPTPGLRRTTVLSDGIGLAHCLLAAEAAGATISLRQADGRVEFRAVLTVPEISAPSDIPAETMPPPRAGCGGGSASALSLLGLDPGSLPTPLRFFVLDDSAASRRILEHQLQTHCPSATVTTFGAAEGDLDLCVARATQEADVVIVDQHLEYSESHLGTAILKRMKLMGFRGLMCIRSGDDSEEDRAYYAACGAHCFLGKDLPAPTLLETIVAAYLMHLA